MLDFLARLQHEMTARGAPGKVHCIYIPDDLWPAFCLVAESLLPTRYMVEEQVPVGETGWVQIAGFKFCKVVELGPAP